MRLAANKILRNRLTYPPTCRLDIDDPRIAIVWRRVLSEKTVLRRIYEEWYADIAALLPPGGDGVLELGSGAGFLKDYIPDLITSEVFSCDGVMAMLDGQRLPLCDGTLRAIVMTDVLHHLP